MRCLLLLRHAKAERGDARLDDALRPLAPRGERDALRLGEELARRALAPERVLCSPARRTRETLERIRAQLPPGTSIEFDPALYLARPGRLLERIAGVDDAVGSLLLVGHSPGIAELALRLAGGGDPAALAAMREKFPTCALAEIHLPAPSWGALAPASGRLTAFLTPAALRGEG